MILVLIYYNNLLLVLIYQCCYMTFVCFSRQFTASGPQEASEWVEQIKIVLRGKHMFID